MIVNRVGDIALLIAIGLCGYAFKSVDFPVVFNLIPLYSGVVLPLGFLTAPLNEIICFFLMIAAIGKSAQIGLHI